MSKRRKRYKWKRKELQDEFRNDVFSRCLNRCVICMATEHLHLAHITSVIAFVKALGEDVGMRASYRDDNLICLCSSCHMSYHKKPTIFIKGHRPARDTERCRKVVILFNEIKKLRGWSNVQELLKIEPELCGEQDDFF